MCKNAVRRDDGELVRRTLAGDGTAFAELVRRYRGMAYGTAFHYLGDAEEAQDAAQEAFLHVYGHLHDLREPDKFSPWLRRAVVNACTDLRRLALRREKERALPPPPPAPENLTTRLMVQAALVGLSEKTRLTVTLFYGGGYSHAEIARFLDIPLNTVRSRLQHAKRQLREEMQFMVSDTLNDDQPDEQWTQRVVEEALRRGQEAQHSYRNSDAARHYDEALAAIAEMPPGDSRRRLTMEALWGKGDALDPNHSGRVEAIPMFRQAVALAEELGDAPGRADKLIALGRTFHNGRQNQEAEGCYYQALTIYRQWGNAPGQAECLMSLGFLLLWTDTARSRALFEEAWGLLQSLEALSARASCRAMLDVMAEVGAERVPGKIIGFFAGCDGLRRTQGAISHDFENCIISYVWNDTQDRLPMRVQRVLWQVSHLSKFLDVGVPVGGRWSGNAFSYSQQPLRATVTVRSGTAHVTVPAGVFRECLLMEQVTTESELTDEASEEAKQANRAEFCGIRRAWYAPGVGLVQLHVRREDGLEACIQLQDYSVTEGGQDYLPLAVNNTWTYGWADIPEEYIAKEVYRVTADENDLWFLEHYAFADRRGDRD